MTALNSERSVMMQMEAAKKLLADLKSQGFSDDAELVSDTIEGETSFNEAMAAGLDELDECDILEVGLEAKIQVLEARLKMTKDRAGRIRAIMERAMMETEQTTLKLPSATISLRKSAPALVIVNEADIPAKFFVAQERPAPKLDKKSLSEAIKGGEAIPGATLDNGSFSISVRRK